MSDQVFVIGDTHFGHKLAAEARGFESLKEHDDYMVEQWNSVVNSNDTVWHLGDVAFSKDALRRVADCNGYKKLVMGNHDQYPTEDYLNYFARLYGVIRYKNVVLSHVPIHPNELCYRWEHNIHGHIHHKERVIQDGRYTCVNADITNLKPVLFTDICL